MSKYFIMNLMISCILLSAGLSSRFGSSKALAFVDGQILINRTQNILIQSQIDEIIIVLGSQANDVKPYLLKHKKVKVVYNKNYNLGQTSSFKVGLKNVHPKSLGIMLLPIDFPVIKSETINLLAKEFLAKEPAILIPSYNSRKGHPPVFHSKFKKDFLALENDCGLNTIQHREKDEIMIIEVNDSGVIKTFNTLEELEQIVKVKI